MAEQSVRQSPAVRKDGLNGHGRSQATPRKLEVFREILRHRLAKFSRMLRGTGSGWIDPLFVVDLNAGPGWNACDGRELPGTPLLAARAINELGLSDRCVHILVDHNKNIIAAHENEWQLCYAKSIRCDNAEYLSTFNPCRRAGGVIICDPNGPAGFPYEELGNLSERCPYFDYIVNHNVTATLRCNGVQDPKLLNGMARYSTLADKPSLLKSLGKNNHLVSGEHRPGRTSWWIFLATNDPKLKAIRKCNLYRSDTPEGRRLLSGDASANATQMEWRL